MPQLSLLFQSLYDARKAAQWLGVGDEEVQRTNDPDLYTLPLPTGMQPRHALGLIGAMQSRRVYAVLCTLTDAEPPAPAPAAGDLEEVWELEQVPAC